MARPDVPTTAIGNICSPPASFQLPLTRPRGLPYHVGAVDALGELDGAHGRPRAPRVPELTSSR